MASTKKVKKFILTNCCQPNLRLPNDSKTKTSHFVSIGS